MLVNNKTWNFLRLKEKIFMKFFKETLITIIGCIFMSIGIVMFLLPNQLSSGGFSRNCNTFVLPFWYKGWNS